MATHFLDRLHLGAMIDPTQTTDPVIWQPYSILATNDVWKHGVFIFGSNNAAQPTVRTGIFGVFKVPNNYVGTAVLLIEWSATITSGNVVWDFDYRTVSGNDTTSLDQAGTEEAVTGTDAVPGTTNRQLQFTINLTSANFAAGETVEWALYRDGVDAADTAAGSAILHNLTFQYADV